MDLLLIRSLLAVAEAGTIGQASSRLGISQSALSRRLMQLEEELGVELLASRGRGVVLTEAGRIAVVEGALLVERMERLKGSIREHLNLDAGTVRIGGGATAVSYLLPEAMARFRKSYPKIRFRLEEAGSSQIEAAVLEERVELGVVTLPVHSKDLEMRPLIKDRIVLVAAPEHPLATKKVVSAAELKGQAVVGFEAGSAIRRLIDEALRKAAIEVNVVMEVRSIASILRLVDATASLAFVSEMGVEKRPVLKVKDFRVERALGLVTKRGRPVSPAALAFAVELARR